MLVPLPQTNGPVQDVIPGLIREGPGAGLILERWDHRYFESCARLIQLAYANHVDGCEINDQYRSESGALRFLKNIIILPGCGQFQAEASFVLRQPHAGHLAGVVLNSSVSAGVGHTTQICAVPGYQGHGLGRRLMEASLQALRFRRYTSVSLTVTSGNETCGASVRTVGIQYDQKIRRWGLDRVLPVKILLASQLENARSVPKNMGRNGRYKTVGHCWLQAL